MKYHMMTHQRTPHPKLFCRCLVMRTLKLRRAACCLSCSASTGHDKMEGLNPIACEHCRAKKCKCDRKLPSCSQCQASTVTCHYVEGGKRGIPAVYMSSLEKRLQETELALYGALAALEENGMLACATIAPLAWHQLSKVEKQDEWTRLPLKSKQQLGAWYREKQRAGHYSETREEHMLSSEVTSIYGPDGRGTKVNGNRSRATGTVPMQSEQLLAALPRQQQMNSGTTQEQLSRSTLPDISNSAASETSNLWRNYF